MKNRNKFKADESGDNYNNSILMPSDNIDKVVLLYLQVSLKSTKHKCVLYTMNSCESRVFKRLYGEY